MEYILLLAFTVSVVVGLAAQLYRPLNKWLDSYVGTYVDCLLDYGELPSLGAPDSGAGECAQELQTANASLNGINKGNLSNKNSTSSENNAKKNGASSGPQEASTVREGSSRNASKSSSELGGTGADSSGPEDGKKTRLVSKGDGSSERFSSNALGSSNDSTSSRERKRELSMDNLSAAQRKQLEKKSASKSRAIAALSEEELKANSKKMPYTPPKLKKLQEIETKFELGLGQVMKYAVIIIIILAIIVVLGGQFLQISKSTEK